MKNFRKAFAFIATLALTAAITGCSSAKSAPEATAVETAAAAASEKIIVGASSTPHGEILEQIKDDLAAEGYELEIVLFDDYVLPNTSLQEGSLDANYFQHTPYLESFNASNGTDIVSAASIHYEPFGLYGNGVSSPAEAKEGATIIIPADDSNETRALLLLAQEGLITLPEGANAADGVTTLDIADNKGYNIITVQADTVAAQFGNSDEGTLAVINGNYALAAGLDINNAIAIEDASGSAAQTYANIVAVRNGDENSPKITALVNALKTDKVKKFIEDNYNGAVVAIF
ncbi:MAG: MetQ/NlpA family ABC transporter substrate-binding protein [Oscillospiraceae bacterium]|nr:MetQ/NlpA family ABC transporter substrate-binding protein [Oscillospiraceae bacterium]